MIGGAAGGLGDLVDGGLVSSCPLDVLDLTAEGWTIRQLAREWGYEARFR